MPKIDFYLIIEQTENERLRFACRLLDKAYQQNHQVYVHVANESDANTFNNLLWTFRDISFVPHDLVGGKNSENTPILIGFDNKPENTNDILLNLDHQIPDFFTKFERVVEIVSQDKELQKKARENYSYYKEQGFKIETHDLRRK
jgi:DNA polymerase III subunit chi